MTTQHESPRTHSFVVGVLPWLVAICAGVFYAATLNHGFSISNLDWATRASGDQDPTEIYHPLYFLATYPLRWLPFVWLPWGLNLFSAACATAVLGWLSRSIALLPHDRTHDQRLREEGANSLLSLREAWLPPVLAALVLGLQLSLWTGATNGERELLDLAFLAYIIRCVLEFRIYERNSWLYRAALAYGLVMTESWVMVALLPIFVGALIWLRGVSFFNFPFLRNLLLFGLAGLLLYLLLPALHIHTHHDATFWQVLKFNWKGQIQNLNMIRHFPSNYLFLLAMTSLLPLLLMGIKWASHFGDPSPLGTALTTSIFHLFHGALMGTCLWAAFDPAFGPRHSIRGWVDLINPLIYLSALGIGYFCGYFLLISVPLQTRARYVPAWKTLLHRTVQGLMFALLLLMPAGLISKNLTRIQFENGPVLQEYAAKLAQNLPAHAVVLSDEPVRLLLARYSLSRSRPEDDFLFLNTKRLFTLDYFTQFQALHPQKQPARTPLELVFELSQQRPIYYLHYSFGTFFEYFYGIPHGLVFELHRFDTNSVSPPPLTGAQIAENETFWSQDAAAAGRLLPFLTAPKTRSHPGFGPLLTRKLHIPFEPSPVAILLGKHYSLAQNVWGCLLEKADKTAEAQTNFSEALLLNPDNIPASRNLEYSKNLLASKKTPIKPIGPLTEFLNDKFANPRLEELYLQEGGPTEDPNYRIGLALYVFDKQRFERQEAVENERINRQTPEYLPTRLSLVKFYNRFGFFDKTLALLPGIRAQADKPSEFTVNKYWLLKMESEALFATGRAPEAEKKLREETDQHPQDLDLLQTVTGIYERFQSFTNALHAVNLYLRLKPDDVEGLMNKGYLCLQLGDLENALALLNAVLAIQTNNTAAKLNRAIAYLRNNQLEESQRDYADLEKEYPHTYQIDFGLGEIARRRNETNSAIQYYERYFLDLKTANGGREVSETEEMKQVHRHLESLGSSAQ